MLRLNVHSSRFAGNVFRRCFSTGTGANSKKEQLGPVKRMQNFFSGNKQALLNMIGIYLVLTISYQNFKTSNRRQELEAKEKISDELMNNIDQRISNDEWIEAIVEKVSQGENKAEKVSVLKSELQKVKKPLPKIDAPTEIDELSLLVKEFTEDSSNKSSSSGKMI